MSSRLPQLVRSMAIRAAISLVLAVAATVVLVMHWQTVSRSLRVARGASIGWLAVSVVLAAATFAVAALIYGALALHRLQFRRTVVIEVAGACINRLLPAGIGGLGLHGLYLYRSKHTGAEATVVVSVNNLVGIAAHLLLLAAALTYRPQALHAFTGADHQLSWKLLVGALLAAAVILLLPAVHRRLLVFARTMLLSVRKLRAVQLVRAMGAAMLLTLTYTATLAATARALHLHLGLVELFLVFSIGMLVGTAAPTPGGLVGAEAGLFAGFTAYGVAAPQAGAAVLLYRLVTYWLPLVPGAIALLAARQRRWV